MKLIATRKADQNRAVLDPWTVVHFATGLAAGLVGMSLRSSVAAAVAYEFAEQYAERQNWGQEFFQTSRYESISNAVVDVVVFAAGHQIGKLWNDTGR